MKLLILGGIGEALALTRALCREPFQPTYSLAGKGEVPPLDCPVRVGGFGGIQGLVDYLQQQQFDLIIDATHPYAQTISEHAFEAADRAGTPLWGYQRPPWSQEEGDCWIQTPDWHAALGYSGFARPLITIGSSVQPHLDHIPDGEHWLVRALPGKIPAGEGYEVIDARGPFSLDDERALMQQQRIDVLVAKNSGGSAVGAKITAARELKIPVIFQARPQLPEPERLFIDTQILQEALAEIAGITSY